MSATKRQAAREGARKRLPAIRRRAMPCPSCDAELDRLLANTKDPACPECGQALLPVEAAGFWRQALAGLVDLALIAAVAVPCAWALRQLIGSVPLAPGARGLDLALSVFATDFDVLLLRVGPVLVLAGVYFMSNLAWAGRTPGQRLLSTRVVDRHGQRPSLVALGLRTVAQLAGLVAAALGPLWIAFDSERRAVHDLVAGTYVVRSA